MGWQFHSREAVFVQISNRLRCEILNGTYRPNEQIPSVRQLAVDAAVNPNTMQKALACLEEEGLLYTKGTMGRFVTADISVLEKARARMKRETVLSLLSQAKSLGITVQDLIEIAEEEEARE